MHHLRRLASLVALLAAICSAESAAADTGAGQVKLKLNETSIGVTIGEKPFTTYHFDPKDDPQFVRPYFFPVLAPDGTPLTSDQIQAGGDHPHHRSFYVAHGEVSGADHWSLAQGARQPRQRHVGFDKIGDDTIVQRLEWESADRSSVLLNETRTIRFLPLDDAEHAWAVDLTVALTPAGDQPVTLGDTKEAGLCSVRVAKAISDESTITNAAGQTGEKECWGKPAAWCDTSGKINGKRYGVAILDHPSNPRHPSRWHVRDYGLMTANVFGLSAFDKAPTGSGAMKLEPAKTTTFRYRVIFHAGDAKSAGIAEQFKTFASDTRQG